MSAKKITSIKNTVDGLCESLKFTFWERIFDEITVGFKELPNIYNYSDEEVIAFVNLMMIRAKQQNILEKIVKKPQTTKANSLISRILSTISEDCGEFKNIDMRSEEEIIALINIMMTRAKNFNG